MKSCASTLVPAWPAAFLQDFQTPAVIVDRAVLERDIGEGAARARSATARLRPHVKSHKSIAIARMQIEAGATGITVAKSSEALPFIAAGIGDITVAYPLVERPKIAWTLAAAKSRGTILRLIADSPLGLHAIAAEAVAHGMCIEVLVKIDVGLHRCGVDPADDGAVRLARMIADRPELKFGGIISHAGQAYSAPGADAVRAVAKRERSIMLAVASEIDRAGIAVPCVSVGSTPTVWLNDDFEGISEIRPGNYVFMDLTQVSLGVASRSDLALSVLTTVVSCNDTYAIIDAGSKVLSSDRGAHGSTRLVGYGVATRPDAPDEPDMSVASLSEEHGFVAHGGRRPEIGQRLRVWPNHACTVVNLARDFTLLDAEGIGETVPVNAQGCVR